MVKEPSHVNLLSLNHVRKIGLNNRKDGNGQTLYEELNEGKWDRKSWEEESFHYKKRLVVFPSPSRDVTHQTLPWA
jgi:hypothetical protein